VRVEAVGTGMREVECGDGRRLSGMSVDCVCEMIVDGQVRGWTMTDGVLCLVCVGVICGT
jgi:hypothetical protein